MEAQSSPQQSEKQVSPNPSPEKTQTQVSDNTDIATSLETENFIDTYQLVAEWIRFADAKAAAVLTACGALAGVLIPTLRNFLAETSHLTPWWEALGVSLFSCWLLLLMASSWSAFHCILPYRKEGKHPAIDRCQHFHPASISSAYTPQDTEKFIGNASQLAPKAFMTEVMAGLHLDSHISNIKYQYVSRAIRLLGASAFFGFLYLIVIQL